MLLVQDLIKTNAFLAQISLTFYQLVLASLYLATLGLILEFLRQKANAKNVLLIARHVHHQFLAVNVLMVSLHKVLISLNLLLFRCAPKFVEMAEDLKPIVMTITQYQEMDAVKTVKLKQDGPV